MRVESTSVGSVVSSSSGYKRRKEQQTEIQSSRNFLQVSRDLRRGDTRRDFQEIKDPKEWISRLSDVAADEWLKTKQGHEGMGDNVEQELVDRVVSVVERHQFEANMDGIVLLCGIIDELTRRGVMATERHLD